MAVVGRKNLPIGVEGGTERGCAGGAGGAGGGCGGGSIGSSMVACARGLLASSYSLEEYKEQTRERRRRRIGTRCRCIGERSICAPR